MRTVTRRSFLKWGSALLGPLFVRGNLLLPQRIGAQSEEAYHQDNGTLHTSIGQSFLGEKLTYSAEFLWFKRVVTIETSFEALPQDKQFLGTVKGQTHGFIGLATWFRRDILTCRMEEVDGGKRLRPLECRDDVIIGSRQRKALTVFDYSAGQVMITKEKDNKVRQKTIPIPQGETFYDPISGSYNFRFGSFGPIERGREYVIKTVPKKNFTSIRINIASPEEEEKISRPLLFPR